MADNAHYPTRPWTPGPWVVYNGNVWAGGDPEVEGDPLIHTHRQRGGVGATDWGHGHPRVTRPEDAALIALAPEMAEAILKYFDCHKDNCEACDSCGGLLCGLAMKLLAMKLRAIGGCPHCDNRHGCEACDV